MRSSGQLPGKLEEEVSVSRVLGTPWKPEAARFCQRPLWQNVDGRLPAGTLSQILYVSGWSTIMTSSALSPIDRQFRFYNYMYVETLSKTPVGDIALLVLCQIVLKSHKAYMFLSQTVHKSHQAGTSYGDRS